MKGKRVDWWKLWATLCLYGASYSISKGGWFMGAFILSLAFIGFDASNFKDRQRERRGK